MPDNAAASLAPVVVLPQVRAVTQRVPLEFVVTPVREMVQAQLPDGKFATSALSCGVGGGGGRGARQRSVHASQCFVARTRDNGTNDKVDGSRHGRGPLAQAQIGTHPVRGVLRVVSENIVQVVQPHRKAVLVLLRADRQT